MLRSGTAGNRPSGRQYGEPYVNVADNQFGIFDSSNVARDLIGVPMFSAGTSYSAGNVVNYQGLLYVAKGAIVAGSFNPAQWTPITYPTVSPSLILTNGKLVESHASNAATFAIKTLAGADPSATDPVMAMMPDASILTITTALSLTIPSGAILGTFNNWPFRLWFGLVSNAGTPALVVRQCSNQQNVSVYSVSGFAPDYTTAISPIANSSQVTYGAAAISTAQPFRTFARADYNTGQPTAGSWTVSPSRLVMLSQNSLLPGAAIQEVCLGNGVLQVTGSTVGAWVNTNLTATIILTSQMNPVRIQAAIGLGVVSLAANTATRAQLLRGAAVISGVATKTIATYANQTVTDEIVFDAMDLLQSISNPTYTVQVQLSGGTGTFYVPYNNNEYAVMRLHEIMG